MDQLIEGDTYMTTPEYHNYHTKASNYTIHGTHKRGVPTELLTISTQHAITLPWDSQVKKRWKVTSQQMKDHSSGQATS